MSADGSQAVLGRARRVLCIAKALDMGLDLHEALALARRIEVFIATGELEIGRAHV